MNLEQTFSEKAELEDLLEKFHYKYRDYSYSVPDDVTKWSYLILVCPLGHDYSGSLEDLVNRGLCSTCRGLEAVSKIRAREVNKIASLINTNFDINTLDHDAAVHKRRQLVITCKAGHEVATTAEDIVDECVTIDEYGNDKETDFQCEVCEEEYQGHELSRKLTSKVNFTGNNWSKVNFPNEILNEDSVVTVFCHHGHFELATVKEFEKMSDCPTCLALARKDRIEERERIINSSVDNISARTRMAEINKVNQFIHEAPCSNGHVTHDGRCGLCEGHEDIHVNTLLPYFATHCDFNFATMDEMVSPDEEIYAVCSLHGPFPTTGKRITLGLCHCPYCHANEQEDTVIIYREENELVIYLTTEESSLGTDLFGIEREILYRKTFSDQGYALVVSTYLSKIFNSISIIPLELPFVISSVSIPMAQETCILTSDISQAVENLKHSMETVNFAISTTPNFRINIPSDIINPSL